MGQATRFTRLLSLCVILVVASAAASRGCQAQVPAESDWPSLDTHASSSPVVLDVINVHNTVGLHFKSVFLRVYSDRTAECRHMRFGYDGDKERVKVKKLSPEEYARLQSVLHAPDLRAAKEHYDLVGFVMDSWMTWEINLPDGTSSQRIAIDNFGRGAENALEKAYPVAVVRLGCTLERLRREVYGADSVFPNTDLTRACERETR